LQYPEIDVAICSALSDSIGPEQYLTEQKNKELLWNVYKKMGIEDLKLHFRQEILSPEIVRRSAISLKMNSLFLYPDNSKDKMLDDIHFQLLTKTLKQEYDLIFLDLGNRKKDQTLRFLETADFVVIVFPQARRYLEEFLINKELILKKDRCGILFSGYLGECYIGQNRHFPEAKQNIGETIGVIPMNTAFFAALEQGRTLDFFYRNQQAEKKEDNYGFIVQTKKAAERIRKKLFVW